MAVTVVGIGARTPFGAGLDALIDGLCRGRAMFAPYAPFVAAGVRAPVAAAVPDAVADEGLAHLWPDRAARLLEGAVSDALFDASGMRSIAEALADVRPSRIALCAGTSSSGIGPFCAAQRDGAPRKADDTRYASATEHVARAMGLRGPVMVVCSVCASGSLAIAEAAELLQDGTVDVAIAAGFDPLEAFVGAGFDSLGALCDAPAPFRAARRGLALGEGSAALVMVRTGSLPAWARRSRGTVLGWGGSADAHHLTAPDPSGAGVARAIERALGCAQLDRGRVGAINAHGTGTLFNDAMECAALARVFGPRAGGRPVYTVKGTLGHTLGAAGAIEAAVSLGAMERRIAPPTVTTGEADPACDIDLVTGAPRACDADVTLSLSSAFGGANCALLLGGAA